MSLNVSSASSVQECTSSLFAAPNSALQTSLFLRSASDSASGLSASDLVDDLSSFSSKAGETSDQTIFKVFVETLHPYVKQLFPESSKSLSESSTESITKKIALTLLENPVSTYHPIKIEVKPNQENTVPANKNIPPDIPRCWVKMKKNGKEIKIWIKVAEESLLGEGANVRVFPFNGFRIKHLGSHVDAKKTSHVFQLLKYQFCYDREEKGLVHHRNCYQAAPHHVMPPPKWLGTVAQFQIRAKQTFLEWQNGATPLQVLKECSVACRSLKALHQNDVAHGDVKFDNILLLNQPLPKDSSVGPSENEQTCLADFNLSRLFGANFTPNPMIPFFPQYDELRIVRGVLTPNNDVHGLMIDLAEAFGCISPGTCKNGELVLLSKGIKEWKYIRSFLDQCRLSEIFEDEHSNFRELLEQIQFGNVFMDFYLFFYYCECFTAGCFADNARVSDESKGKVKKQIKEELIKIVQADIRFQEELNADLFRQTFKYNLSNETKEVLLSSSSVDRALRGQREVDIKEIYTFIDDVADAWDGVQGKIAEEAKNFKSLLENSCLSDSHKLVCDVREYLHSLATDDAYDFSLLINSKPFSNIKNKISSEDKTIRIEDDEVFEAIKELECQENLSNEILQQLSDFKTKYDYMKSLRSRGFWRGLEKFTQMIPEEIAKNQDFQELRFEIRHFYNNDTRSREKCFDLEACFKEYRSVPHEVKQWLTKLDTYCKVWHEIFFQLLNVLEKGDNLYKNYFNLSPERKPRTYSDFQDLESKSLGMTCESFLEFLESLLIRYGKSLI